MTRSMPYLLIVALVTIAALAIVNASDARTPLLDKIDKTRDTVHNCQRTLGQPLHPVSSRQPLGWLYRRWVLRLWNERKAKTCPLANTVRTPLGAIRYVFGPYADQAIHVSSCETGGTFHVGAQNGQYLGLFQMGSYARSTYGHSSTPLGQARAAYRYFVASGRDWSPWSCRP